jgi:hypothetical protein
MSRPEISYGKHEETRYVKELKKDYSMSFKLQIVQEIERGQPQLRNPQRPMVFKIEQLLPWSENSVTLIGKPTIYYVKVARTKDLKPKKLEKQKSFWNDRLCCR